MVRLTHNYNIDNIKMFAKNQKELETLIQTVKIFSQHTEMEFGQEKMCHAKNVKRKMKNNLINGTTKSRINQNIRKKRNLLFLGNIGSRHQETSSGRKKKSISGERENYSNPNSIAEISSKW